MKTPNSINSGNGILLATMCRNLYAMTLNAIQTKATTIFSMCYITTNLTERIALSEIHTGERNAS